MTVALCIASRGRPKELERTLRRVHDNIHGPATLGVIVALDDDDPSLAEYSVRQCAITRYLVGPREDTLGAKYNRCTRASNADLYVLGADEMPFISPGWDVELERRAEAFSDGIGMVTVQHPYDNPLPASIAITRKLVARMGHFMPPFFPFWWHDTWSDEIGRMIGRYVPSEARVEHHNLQGPSRGLRDVPFWATFFDATRILRVRMAQGIIAELAEPYARKLELVNAIPALCDQFRTRNAKLRDPQFASQFEGFDAPADERYHRVRDAALAMMQEQHLADDYVFIAA